MFKLESTSPIQKSSAREDYVLNYLRSNGESSISAITDNPEGCSKAGAKKAIYTLVRSGDIIRTNPEEKTKPAIYKIVNE